MRGANTSLDSRGRRRVFPRLATLMLGMFATFAPAHAADGGLPLMFDAREKLARPDLREMKRLRFLTSVDFPPFNFIDETGRLAGFNVDLVREICANLKIEAKCQIQGLPFAELRSALDKGDGEAIIAGFRVTPEIRDFYAVSRPYITLPARFAVHRKAGPPAKLPEALQGQPVGVVAHSAHAAMFAAFFPTLKAQPFPDRDAMLADLKSGKIPAVFGDGLQLTFWSSGPAAEACCSLLPGAYLSEAFLGEGMTILSRKVDPVTNAAIDHALLQLSKTGRLQELYLRYFPFGLF